MMFFDSHGGLWETCSPNAEGATAFGPTGSSRPVPTSPGFYTRAAEAGEIEYDEVTEWEFFTGQKP